MTLENFISLQEELWWAFGWFARWWLIMLAFSGTALSAILFFLSVVNSWLDSK